MSVDYIATCPAQVKFLWQKTGEMRTDKFYHGLAYLGLMENKHGKYSIDFVVSLTDGTNEIIVNISKWHILRMMMFNLSLRPIQPPRDYYKKGDQLWLNSRIKKIPQYKNIDKFDYVQIADEINDAVEYMKRIISYSSGNAERRANQQLAILVQRADRIKLLSQIDKCKNYTIENTGVCL